MLAQQCLAYLLNHGTLLLLLLLLCYCALALTAAATWLGGLRRRMMHRDICAYHLLSVLWETWAVQYVLLRRRHYCLRVHIHIEKILFRRSQVAVSLSLHFSRLSVNNLRVGWLLVSSPLIYRCSGQLNAHLKLLLSDVLVLHGQLLALTAWSYVNIAKVLFLLFGKLLSTAVKDKMIVLTLVYCYHRLIDWIPNRFVLADTAAWISTNDRAHE